MRKRHHRGNTTPRVKVESPENPEKPTPENSARSANLNVDPNLDRKGRPVRVGSIIQTEIDIAIVTIVDNGALICRQLNDTNGGNHNSWSCRNVEVIPNLTYHEHEQGEREKSRSAVPEKLEMSRNGFAVRAGSILKRNGRVYRVTHQEHDWFTGETAEPGMVLTVTGMCGDYDVLPALATNDEEAATETESVEVENVNADANGKPIHIGDIIRHDDGTNSIGVVTSIHNGALTFRRLDEHYDYEFGWQCHDVEIIHKASRSSFRESGKPFLTPIANAFISIAHRTAQIKGEFEWANGRITKGDEHYARIQEIDGLLGEVLSSIACTIADEIQNGSPDSSSELADAIEAAQ